MFSLAEAAGMAEAATFAPPPPIRHYADIIIIHSRSCFSFSFHTPLIFLSPLIRRVSAVFMPH
jgi:hypothetical protein